MEFHSVSCFVVSEDLNHGPRVSLATTGENWPISLRIKSDYGYVDGVTIHLRNESQLIQFVNSVKFSYNKYRKDKGYDR